MTLAPPSPSLPRPSLTHSVLTGALDRLAGDLILRVPAAFLLLFSNCQLSLRPRYLPYLSQREQPLSPPTSPWLWLMLEPALCGRRGLVSYYTSRYQPISEGSLGGNSRQEARAESMQRVAHWLHLSGWCFSEHLHDPEPPA